jgi:hypothetical protein
MEEELPKKRGRVRVKDIDKKQVYELACLQCTLREIAAVVGIDQETIRKHFSDIIEKGRETGKKSLRRAQWEKALSGSDRLLVFLGKNYLGQQDAPDNGEDTQPLPWDED